jgi:hypothetical protein
VQKTLGHREDALLLCPIADDERVTLDLGLGQVGEQQKMKKEKLSKPSDADLYALVNYYRSL